MFKKLVIASNNPGKLREIGQILAPLEIEVSPQSAFGVPQADEPHGTFVENALAKARHAAGITGLPTLADDSGLCVGARPDRQAHYYCVIVVMRHARDPQPLIAQALWRGEILRAPRGSGGFGYDPLFLVPEFGQTGAELAPARKNLTSHRGKAMALLVDALKQQG